MGFLLLGIATLLLKYLEIGPFASWSWWIVLSPFALTVLWWWWADNSGYTKRVEMEKMEQRKSDRINKQRVAMGMLSAPNKGKSNASAAKGIGFAMKALTAIVVVTVAGVGYLKLSGNGNNADGRPRSASDSIVIKASDAMISSANVDVSMFNDILADVDTICANNKFGLSQQECAKVIEARKDACVQQTAIKYPGQLTDTIKIMEASQSMIGCIFQK